MQRNYFEDKIFERQDYSKVPPLMADYEGCSFIGCNFSNSELNRIHFIDCSFKDCNLSMAKLRNTVLRDVKFVDCKLLGLHFFECGNLFSAGFAGCMLNLSSFYQMNLKKLVITNCLLHEVDFTKADLGNSTFNNCDLSAAIFENTNLEQADFRSAYNYSINPQLNRIKKAKFTLPAAMGLLDNYDIVID